MPNIWLLQIILNSELPNLIKAEMYLSSFLKVNNLWLISGLKRRHRQFIIDLIFDGPSHIIRNPNQQE